MHRQRYWGESDYARGCSGTPACTRPPLCPQILGQPIVPIFSHNRTVSYPKQAPYHGPRKDSSLRRLATQAPAGRACRTGGERVLQSSGIVPSMINGGLRSIFAKPCAVCDMSSCINAELWESFDGAEYNNSSLSGRRLWGGMQNVCDNLHSKCNTLLQCL